MIEISVFILSYNHIKFIRQCIESILAQDIKAELEIIVCDDGSSDGTREIAEEYASSDKRVLVLEKEPNMGLYRNMQRGLNNSNGKFVSCCSADDWWYPNKLSALYEVMQNHKYVMAHSDYDIFWNDRAILEKSFHHKEGFAFQSGDIFEYLLLKGIGTPTSYLCETEVLRDAYDLDEILRNEFCVEDYPWWLNIAAKYEIGYLPLQLAAYRIHNCSHSHKKRDASTYAKRITSMSYIPLYYCEKYNRKNTDTYSRLLARHDRVKHYTRFIKGEKDKEHYSVTTPYRLIYWLYSFNQTKAIRFFVKALIKVLFNKQRVRYFLP